MEPDLNEFKCSIGMIQLTAHFSCLSSLSGELCITQTRYNELLGESLA